MIIEEDEIGVLFNAMGLRIDGLENRWRRFENDDAIANMMQGGIEWIGPSSIAVDELAALAVRTGDLEVTGQLTLGPDGRIVDADGSVWDQDGLTLQAGDDPGDPSDVILFRRTGEDPLIEMKSSITTLHATVSLQARPDDLGTTRRKGLLRLEAGNTDGTAKAYLGMTTAANEETYVEVTDTQFEFYLSDSLLMQLVSGGVVLFGSVLATVNVTASYLGVADAITPPAAVSGRAYLYVDSADGDLKVKFGNGTVKTIATNP